MVKIRHIKAEKGGMNNYMISILVLFLSRLQLYFKDNRESNTELDRETIYVYVNAVSDDFLLNH